MHTRPSGEADTMHDTAVCLTVNSIDITDTSNEVNTGEFQNCHGKEPEPREDKTELADGINV